MISDFLKGITSYSEGLRLLRSLRLFRYVWITGILSLLLAALIIFLSYSVSDNIGGWLTGWYKWETGQEIVQRVGSIFGGVFVLALGYILYKNLVIVLVGPFMSPLSERIESHMTGKDVSVSMWDIKYNVRIMIRGLRVALRNIIRELFFTVILLLLGLIPVFSPFVPVLIFALQAYYAGFGNMDFTLERHFNVKNSVRFVSQNKGLAIGNGTVYLLMISTLIGVLFAPALSTAASTVELVKKLDHHSSS